MSIDINVTNEIVEINETSQIVEINAASGIIEYDPVNLITNVRNQTGSTIEKLKVVYISGATGNKPLVSLASNATQDASSKVYGVTRDEIANNGTGYVVTVGELRNVNTQAYNEGDQLWLGVNGNVLTAPPAEPAYSVFIGFIIRKHPNLGVVDVRIQNGYELDELHGVQITTPTNGQVLKYDSTSGLWINAADSAPVSSVFGRTGAVVATEGDYSLTQLSDVTLTSPTTNQVLKYNGTTWVNSSDADTGITSLNSLTALTQTFAVGTSGSDFNISSATSTHTLNIPDAGPTSRGLITSSTQTIAGVKTFSGNRTNINGLLDLGNYIQMQELTLASGSPSSGKGYIWLNSATSTLYFRNDLNVDYDLTANSGGTVTSIALATGTTGTDVNVSGSPITSSGTITLNIPTASASVRGVLSSADWSTFNNKQGALTLTTTGTSGAATLVGTTLNIPQYSGGGGMAIGGAITSATAGSVLFAGTSGVLQQDNANFFWDDTNNRLGIGTETPTHVFNANTASSSLPPVRISDFYYDYYIGYGASVGTSKNNNYTWTYRGSNQTWWVSSQGGHNFVIGSTRVGTFSTNAFILGSITDDTFNRLQVTGSAVFYGTGFTNKFTTTGRLLLGGTIESTYILDVNGAFRAVGSSISIQTDSTGRLGIGTAPSATHVLTVQGNASFNNAILANFQLYCNFIRPLASGQEIMMFASFGATYGVSFWQSFNDSDNSTTGTRSLIRAGITFNPTSGTAVRNQLLLDPIINQTGVASGISRGLYINPTLTAAADWRSIETSNNTGWAAYFGGSADLFFNDATDLQFGTTTGTKIGTATTQKIALWNATPIVQPTNGIAEATFVENSGGTAVNVDSTFAGYTLQQITQALKDFGLLA